MYIWHSKNSRDKRKRGLSQQQCQLFTVWYELAYQHMPSATNCNAVQWVFNEPTTEGSTLCNIKHQWYKLPMYACSMQPAWWPIEWLSQCFWLKSSNFQPVQCNQLCQNKRKMVQGITSLQEQQETVPALSELGSSYLRPYNNSAKILYKGVQ